MYNLLLIIQFIEFIASCGFFPPTQTRRRVCLFVMEFDMLYNPKLLEIKAHIGVWSVRRHSFSIDVTDIRCYCAVQKKPQNNLTIKLYVTMQYFSLKCCRSKGLSIREQRWRVLLLPFSTFFMERFLEYMGLKYGRLL